MSDTWAKLIFVLLLVVSASVVVWVARDVLGRRTTRATTVVGGIAVLLAVVGIGLTVVPVTASTGAECGMQPTTMVLGPSGSEDLVEQAAPGTDRTSTQSCIDKARARTTSACVLIVLGAAGYAVARRPTSGAR